MRIVGVCRARFGGLVLTALLSVCLLFCRNESADGFTGGGSGVAEVGALAEAGVLAEVGLTGRFFWK